MSAIRSQNILLERTLNLLDCCNCDVRTPYILGSHTVIHPCAKILAETGPIVIGENNLIEENVTIINKYVQ